MRQTHPKARIPAFTVLSCAIAVAVLAASPARAQDQEGSLATGLVNLLIGKNAKEEPINYQERSPLVVPPSRALPPPEKTGDVAVKDPAWPNDPDIARRRVEAKREQTRDVSEEMRRASGPLPQNELEPYGTPRTGRPTHDQVTPDTSDDLLTPSQLGYKGGMFGSIFNRNFFSGVKAEETAKFTGEKPRTTLIEPPAGYRTPSPDQPYGIGKARSQKPEDNYITRGEKQSGN